MPIFFSRLVYLFSLSLFCLLTSCDTHQTTKSSEASLIDVIIVRGKTDVRIEAYGQNERVTLEDVDSFRVETDEIIPVLFYSEGADNKYFRIVPGMATKRDKNGVEKIYITTGQGINEISTTYRDLDYQLKVRSRWMENGAFYHFEDLTSFYQRDKSRGYRSNNLSNNSVDEFEKRHQLEIFHEISLTSVVSSGFRISDAFKENPDPWLSDLKDFQLGLYLDSMFIVGIEREVLCVQVYGAWELFNGFGEKVFTYPIKSFSTIGDYSEKEYYTTGYQRSILGETISEALGASLTDLLLSNEFLAHIESSERIAKEDSLRNSRLDPIRLRRLQTFRSRSVEDNMLASVHVTKNGTFGSGSVISSNGYILTNYHVITPVEDETEVLFSDGNRVKAEVVRYDRDLDVALLKVDTTGLITASIATSSSVSLGDEIYTIATPLHSALMNSVLFGRVSAFRETGVSRHIQSDGTWHRGCSGGPVFNDKGQQIGLHVWGWERNKTFVEGINFAIPIGEALARLNLKP